MATLLHIDSSAAGELSATRALSRAFAETWRTAGPERRIVVRDLHADQLPHLGSVALHRPRAARGETGFDPAQAALQDRVLAELLAADVVVIGAPMYNYSMPSTLKAWLDLVHIPGETAFTDPADQPLRGKRAVVVTARGIAAEPGIDEYVTGPLRQVLAVACGMDFEVVSTSRTLANVIPALGPEHAAAEFEQAMARVRELAARPEPA
ncbi:FMN-dependent NADH-azoreductase [Leucobacter luti]|uniref:FMN-dependent NADH-azoreductase n=1 Tax=Leucobacter luti TaxID=340320 RepID=UPI00104AAA13|nr:NAD(P)H-dependent oxidoreductase [Leucobacter luti]MCW2289238.1 FMN-dependent NADH-azoreductase [Leucobacter luti]TCK39801.1 FMN-dependent NADH-azoreductase [Leucobacter luti]